EAVAAPVVRQVELARRDGVRVELLQRAARLDRLALATGAEHGADAGRRVLEVASHLLARERRYRSRDPHLTHQQAPEARPRRPRCAGEVLGLGRLNIGLDDEALGIEVLQEHHADTWTAVPVDGGQ